MPICNRSRTALRYCPGVPLASTETPLVTGLSRLSGSGLVLAVLFSLLNTGRKSNPDRYLLQLKADSPTIAALHQGLARLGLFVRIESRLSAAQLSFNKRTSKDGN